MRRRAATRELLAQDGYRLLNEPTGTTGAAPDSMPLLLAAGTEKAVRISRSGARGGSASACFTRGFGAATGVLSATSFGFGGATSRGLGAATGALSATA